jgi:hypothetical protein
VGSFSPSKTKPPLGRENFTHLPRYLEALVNQPRQTKRKEKP